jgi:hypothetical protein
VTIKARLDRLDAAIPPLKIKAGADLTITAEILREWVPICRDMGDYWLESFDKPPFDNPKCREFAAQILAAAEAGYPEPTRPSR